MTRYSNLYFFTLPDNQDLIPRTIPFRLILEEEKKLPLFAYFVQGKKKRNFIDPRNNDPALIALRVESRGKVAVVPQSARISGGPIAREVSIVGKRDIAATPLSRSGTAPCRSPSFHPSSRVPRERMGPRVSEGLGKPGGDGLATRSAFHPPSQCTYMCISTSRSRRFVSVQGGEETIEERPVADSRGSNGSTWFPAGNWVREVIGYTLFVADIKRDKLCKYFPVINEFLSKESRYSRMVFWEKDSSRVKLFFVE